MDVLGILLRWTHIASMAFLAGGALYATLVLRPALAELAETDKSRFLERASSELRVWMIVALAALVASGLTNLLRKASYPPGYHLWFGIKILLALHAITAAMLLTRPGCSPLRHVRLLAGIAISALGVMAVSAYLRSLA